MGRSVRKASERVGDLLRQARVARNWTLQQVSELLAADGDRIPESTLVRIEQGTRDPGATRLLRLLRLYDISPEAAASAIEIENETVADFAAKKELDLLVKEGTACWRRGEIEEALARLRAVRAIEPTTSEEHRLRHEGLLALANVLRSLGRPRAAKQVLDELLQERAEDDIVFRALIVASSIWRGLGSKAMALATVRQAWALVQPDEVQKFAWVLHQQAKVLLEFECVEDANRSLHHALRHYRNAGDRIGELHGLLLKIGVVERLGRVDAAFATARRVVRRATKANLPRLAMSARVELGRLNVAVDKPQLALVPLRAALKQAVEIGDRNAEFMTRYYLWKSLAAVGDSARARAEFLLVKRLVAFVEETSTEVKEVSRLSVEGALRTPLAGQSTDR